MALRSYRFTPSRSTGLTNLVFAGAILVVGIVAAVRGELTGGGPFLFVWIGLGVVMLVAFARTALGKPRSTRVLLPGRRWSGSRAARSLGTLEPDDDHRP